MEHDPQHPQPRHDGTQPEVDPQVTLARHQAAQDVRHHKVGRDLTDDAAGRKRDALQVAAPVAFGLMQQPRQRRHAGRGLALGLFTHPLPPYDTVLTGRRDTARRSG